ncbi:MAG: UDP-N-acetylmuramate dehydrogenase [Propionibacteriaceae bacterium]|jgi:UDP-N-acetylmuramate dehydrogenase|nr:UDP-N-acetylmuramate dehydrogenase [Propionibacteriaceae bacterium]
MTSDSPLLADHTTFRVGGPARHLVTATTERDLIAAVRAADARGEPLLVLGGGSNVLVGDAGFPGTVVVVATTGEIADESPCAGAYVTVAAGEPWDGFVARAVEREWVGLETLSGVPGSVGATPVQNVGAYGAEAGQWIGRVRTFDRATGRVASFAAADCGFGYRTSRFKQAPGRYVILSVEFQLKLGPLSEPIRYAELAARLGVPVGERAPLGQVRHAVLELRRSKGTLVDPADHDTWSAGSFFTNPVLPAAAAAALPEGAPRYPQPDGQVKASAAWLIEQAGFGKGYGAGPATLSTKHVLALTNRGGASAADILALAREVRDGVRAAFGVTLVPEPVLVNCEL